jgi:hypothetical protein
VDENDFEEALARLVLETPLTLLPSQQGRLVRASYPSNDAGKRLISQHNWTGSLVRFSSPHSRLNRGRHEQGAVGVVS